MAYILVADDEAPIRSLISEILESDGHEIAQVRDGEEALASIDARMPDLIVLDLAMPGMDGWHFLDELHRRELRARTRVVIVSGRFEIASVLADHRTSPGCFLTKPFEEEDLRRLVSETLEIDPGELYQLHAKPDTLARLVEKVDRVLHH